jgi:hypothetical protein
LQVEEDFDLPALEDAALGSALDHLRDQAVKPLQGDFPLDEFVFLRHTAVIGIIRESVKEAGGTKKAPYRQMVRYGAAESPDEATHQSKKASKKELGSLKSIPGAICISLITMG